MSTTPQTMKRTPFTDDWGPWMSPSHPEQPDAPAFDMSITVGLQHRATRSASPAPTATRGPFRSHQRAVQAIDEGRFEDEIVAIEVKLRDGTTKIFDTDEHPRRDSTLEKMAVAQAAAPGDRGLPDHRGQRVGSQRRRRRDDDRQQRLRGGARPHAARQDRVVGVDRARTRATPASARSCRSRRRSSARA